MRQLLQIQFTVNKRICFHLSRLNLSHLHFAIPTWSVSHLSHFPLEPSPPEPSPHQLFLTQPFPVSVISQNSFSKLKFFVSIYESKVNYIALHYYITLMYFLHTVYIMYNILIIFRLGFFSLIVRKGFNDPHV